MKRWNYAQFEPDCVDAAFKIAETIDDFDRRNDVVEIVRTVSQMVNATDGDNGVIVGNWSQDFSDGR